MSVLNLLKCLQENVKSCSIKSNSQGNPARKTNFSKYADKKNLIILESPLDKLWRIMYKNLFSKHSKFTKENKENCSLISVIV